MKTIQLLTFSITLLFAAQSATLAQSGNISETFKQHFNETVEKVHNADSAEVKRDILNDSFTKMITALERIETRANLTEDEFAQLESYKNDIQDKKNELNGLDGFDEVLDEDLDDFSSYSQQFLEQANRVITISLGTAVLIGLLLLLL